jgi:hypothetical protein
MGNTILPVAPQNTTEFARADNTWAVPSSGAGSGYIWRGAWNTTTTYNPMDTVSRSGSSYVCTVANINSDPAVDTTHWNLMAQAGSPGSKWYNGSSDPVTVTGAIPGDYYLNDISGGVFQLQ